MSVRVLCLLGLLCMACAGRTPRTRAALDVARMQEAQRLGAKQRAPELWRELEQARAAAAQAGEDEAARADHTAAARLWLEAAIAECERADLAAKRLLIEREIEGLHAAALRDQRRASQLTHETSRKMAASLARREAALALERAATVPARRPKLDKAAELSATRALITRAQLVIGTARALGASPATYQEATALAERADAALPARSDQALDLADRALSKALAALGPLRAAQPEVAAGDKLALVEDLEVLGARVARGDQGLSARLDGVSGTAERLSATAGRKLGRLCAVALAHPHGPVRFVVSSADAQAGARQSTALTQSLTSAGCASSRFSVVAQQASSAGLELHFLAY